MSNQDIDYIAWYTNYYIPSKSKQTTYPWTPLHFAAQSGNGDKVLELVTDHGANVNAQNNLGETPLHHAAGQGHYQVVLILLLQLEANFYLKDINGRVAINWALENNHIKIAWLLWTHQEENDLTGQSPLHQAALDGNFLDVELLVRKLKCNVHTSDMYGCTPLLIAINMGNECLTNMLMELANLQYNVPLT